MRILKTKKILIHGEKFNLALPMSPNKTPITGF